MQPGSPTFSQSSQSNNQQQQQQPCECTERINCTHTGDGDCDCSEEVKPCSHTAGQRRSRRTCDCSGSGSQPCSHKPQHEGRIKRVKCRVRRAGCAMARCTAELAMLHLHWGLATECAPCRPRALTRRLCRRQQSDNELYRSNSFKFERFERSKDECATPLRKQVSGIRIISRRDPSVDNENCHESIHLEVDIRGKNRYRETTDTDVKISMERDRISAGIQ